MVKSKCLTYLQEWPKIPRFKLRPISLTCIASKLMEHILVSNIMKHAQSRHFFMIFNMAFDLVCHVRQLIQFTHDLVTNMQSGAQIDVIVMDISGLKYF